MVNEKRNFTVIRLSGKTEFFPDADYFAVLSNIHHEFMSAGGNWDRPNMLLMNGMIVIAEGVADLAWKFGTRNRELFDEAHRKLRDEFKPDWMEAGHAE